MRPLLTSSLNYRCFHTLYSTLPECKLFEGSVQALFIRVSSRKHDTLLALQEVARNMKKLDPDLPWSYPCSSWAVSYIFPLPIRHFFRSLQLKTTVSHIPSLCTLFLSPRGPLQFFASSVKTPELLLCT